MNRRCIFIFMSTGGRRKESEISDICLFLVTHLNHELTRAAYELRVWLRACAQLKTLSSLLKSTLDGFFLQLLLRSLREYILKQLFFSISVKSGRIFTSPLCGSVNILPLFTSIPKNNC